VTVPQPGILPRLQPDGRTFFHTHLRNLSNKRASFPQKRESIGQHHGCPNMDSRFRGNDALKY
jgi:hypothetical protein